MQKRYLYLSLTFNAVVILTFVFFTFIYPYARSKKNTTDLNFRQTLSETQKQSLDSLSEIYLQMEFPLKVQNIENRLRLWELLMEEQIDIPQVQLIMDSLIAGESAQKILRYELYLKEKYLLTAEQRRIRLEPTYLKLKTYLQELHPTVPKP
jgi:hypothetical protein